MISFFGLEDQIGVDGGFVCSLPSQFSPMDELIPSTAELIPNTAELIPSNAELIPSTANIISSTVRFKY